MAITSATWSRVSRTQIGTTPAGECEGSTAPSGSGRPAVLDRGVTDEADTVESVSAPPGRSSTTVSRSTSELTRLSDAELIVEFQHGVDRAFAVLYQRHKEAIYTYCLRMMAGDPDTASDAFQEVFIKVYEKAEQFREGSNVMGWLYMIARNTCLNVFRARKPNDSIDAHLDLANRDRSLAPEYDEEQHSLREKLEEAIAKLPMEFREPFVLREYQGFSYSEIAEMTGTTLAMTKVRIHRAKQKMRELLRPYLNE